MYKVTGLSESELRPHLNKQVEVQGRIEDGASHGSGSHGSGASSSSSASSSSGTPSSASGASNAPKLHAKSIREVASSCTAGTN